MQNLIKSSLLFRENDFLGNKLITFSFYQVNLDSKFKNMKRYLPIENTVFQIFSL